MTAGPTVIVSVRAARTYGRKQLRFRDVDVEGADDANDDVASQLVARVTG